MKKSGFVFGIGTFLAFASSPAFATGIQTVPEPGALSLIAGAAVAAIIAARFIRRK